MPRNILFTASCRVPLQVLTPTVCVGGFVEQRFNAMTEGITSSADTVDEIISPVSCSNGARSVFMFSNAIEMATAV
jgi:hypothetical protein